MLAKYVLRRILATIPVFGIVALFTFFLLRLTPGDPAAIIAGDMATPQQLEEIRRSLGLDRSIWEQLLTWILNIVHGDLGISLLSQVPVLDMILGRLGPTFILAGCTLVVAVAVAVPLGTIAAARHGSLIDRAVMALSVAGFSLPVFVLGYVFIGIFAVNLKWLPVQGFRPVEDGLWPFLRHLIMPAMTLSLVYIALIARITRASVLETLGEDYVRTARAKGIPDVAVLLGHALRNAAVPIVTVIGTGFAMLISGVVVTESVFNIPGIGRLTIDAVLARDYPVIQGVVLFGSAVYILVNLAVDIAYLFLDPRIRY